MFLRSGNGPSWLPSGAAVLAGALAAGVLLFGSLGSGDEPAPTTSTDPPSLSASDPAVTVVEDFIRAFNLSDRDTFVAMLDPALSVLQWPQSVRMQEPSLDGQWFDFHRELDSEISLDDCQTRSPAGRGVDVYDVLVDCTATATDALDAMLNAEPLTGRLTAGIASGRIGAIFWEGADRTAELTAWDLIDWMFENRPHLAAHWLGGVTGEWHYDADLAEILLSAAADIQQQDVVPPPGADPDRSRPTPMGEHSMAIGSDGRIYLVPGRVDGFVETEAFIWERDADGAWQSIRMPDFPRMAVTLSLVRDRLFMVAADPEQSSLRIFQLESGAAWHELPSESHWGWVFLLDSAYNHSSDRLAVVGWPSSVGLFDVSGAEWIEDTDSGFVSPSDQEPPPCHDFEHLVERFVASEPGTHRFVIAAGGDLCLYDPDSATIELLARDYGPQDTRGVLPDPDGDFLYVLGDAHLWTYHPDRTFVDIVGPLPDEMLWRNVAMEIHPVTGDIVVFDGLTLWTLDPADGTWSRIEELD